jgi:hypothetical protein
MTLSLSTPNASFDNIARAVRNADRESLRYEVSEFASCLWFVTRTDDRARMYGVEITGEGMTCDCPAFAKSAVCKHCVMVRDEIATREMESELENAEDLYAKL